MKKRLLSIFLALCMVLTLLPASAFADVTASGTDGNITWSLDSNGVLTISGTGSMEDYDYGYAPWFTYSLYIKTVDIKSGVTSIGDYAFWACDSFTSVTIPDSVTSIGDYAFSNCDSLTSVTIGNGVTSIGFWAFGNCDSLTSVTIGNSVTSIGDDVFDDCDNLTSIIVSSQNKNYSSIDGVLFDKSKTTLIECPRGKSGSYAIPDGVTSIEDSAFRYCYSLTSVTIPDSVTSIGACAFYDCDGLTSIDVSSQNLNYSSVDGVLFNKSKTTLIKCPGGKIGNYTIPDSVTSIGDGAFYWCESLTSVTIPDSVTSIGDGAFYECDSLMSIDVSSQNKNYSSVDGVLFNKSKTTLIQYPGGKSGCYTIPDSVTSIGDWAFYECDSLTSVTIPNSVTSIGEWVFGWCESLTSVTIGNSVTSIGDYAFYGCESLTSITIPDSVTSIGYSAFDWCLSLTDVYYSGSEAQWQQISINEYNDCLTQATIHYNCVSHTHYYTATVTAPTCTEQGYTTYTCSCGHSYKDNYTEATGHSYTATVTAATTKALGYTTYTCSECGDSYKADYTLAAPTISISRSSGKPKISWSAIGGATKYYVYRSTDGKTYKYLTSTTKTSCTNTKASSGKKYYYKVKAVAVVDGKNIYSAYSNVKYMVTTLTAPTVSKTTSSGHPKISWKAVTGADKYIVYYSTNGKSYSKLVTTTKLSVTHTKAKAGKTYYYKVKAVSNKSSNATSAYSKVVSIKAK